MTKTAYGDNIAMIRKLIRIIISIISCTKACLRYWKHPCTFYAIKEVFKKETDLAFSELFKHYT
jgi:hypothetical protein